MKVFPGFSDRMDYTPVPTAFVTQLMPDMKDQAQLKVCLYLFYLLSKKKGYPRYALRSELLAARPLVGALAATSEDVAGAIGKSLDQSVAQGIFLARPFEGVDGPDEAYYVNTPAAQRLLGQSAAPVVAGGRRPQPVEPPERAPDIFTLYEQNIGLLTPIVAEQLKDAEESYPTGWVEDAIMLAVALNKRRWSTIANILRRWEREGKDDGQPWRHPSQAKDPDRFIKGKYGHIVQR